MTQVRWSVVLFVLTKSIKMITSASTAAWSKKLQKFSVDFFVLVSIVLHFTCSSLSISLSLSLSLSLRVCVAVTVAGNSPPSCIIIIIINTAARHLTVFLLKTQTNWLLLLLRLCLPLLFFFVFKYRVRIRNYSVDPLREINYFFFFLGISSGEFYTVPLTFLSVFNHDVVNECPFCGLSEIVFFFHVFTECRRPYVLVSPFGCV